MPAQTALSRRQLLAAFAAAPLAWKSEPPSDCLFAPSSTLKGIEFTGRQARYGNADTWYPSWASDGNLYSPWTDGKVNGIGANSNGLGHDGIGTTGQAKIVGDSPLALTITDVKTYSNDCRPYGGRYPCGTLVHNGTWYYGTYCLADSNGNPGSSLNWDILGPFVGFRYSKDFGATWTDTPHTPSAPLFGEPAEPNGPVEVGVPHFVDFGRNMEHSPDGKAYLVAHGAHRLDPHPRPANLSWITADHVNLVRVKPSPETINTKSAYEHFGGHDAQGRPVWTRDLARIRPLAEWNNHAGCVTMTYNAPLKRYLLCITDGGNTISRYHTYILESPRITGPWRLVTFLKNFGEQAYFVNIPSKFISADGRTAWLLYSANFTNGYLKTGYAANPPNSGYGMCLQEFRLL